jgi:hypothetical protein
MHLTERKKRSSLMLACAVALVANTGCCIDYLAGKAINMTDRQPIPETYRLEQPYDRTSFPEHEAYR